MKKGQALDLIDWSGLIASNCTANDLQISGVLCLLEFSLTNFILFSNTKIDNADVFQFWTFRSL